MRLLVQVLVVFDIASFVFSCSCFPTHLQHQFCKSKFVIHAIPLFEQKGPDINDDRSYKVFIVDVLKDDTNSMQEWTVTTLYTGGNGAVCGVYLELFKSYILMGSVNSVTNQPRIGLCGVNRLQISFSSCELELLYGSNGYYGYGNRGYDCSCEVLYCDQGNCNLTQNQCPWDFRQSDPTQQSNCLRDQQKNACQWAPC